MKTLIFPDLHEPQQSVLDVIEDIIAYENADKVVFLGDYFDQFNDTPEDAARVARWLKQSLADRRRIHLVGNHDASYLWPCNETYCPGWTPEKQQVVHEILGRNISEKFEFHRWVDDWLLTHAGLAAAWVPPGIDVAVWLDREATKARKAFSVSRAHWFLAVGSSRGGRDHAGGLLWCDWREERWPGRQIFGHTPNSQVRKKECSVCLDTNIGHGPQHFAVLTNDIDVRSLT